MKKSDDLDPSQDTMETIAEMVRQRVEAEAKNMPQPPPVDLNKYLKTEALQNGNVENDARVFVEMFKERLLFNTSAQEWFFWNGLTWKPDTTSSAFAAVGSVADFYYEEYLRVSEQLSKLAAQGGGHETEVSFLEARKKLLVKRVRQLRDEHRRGSVLKFARSDQNGDSLCMDGNRFDQHPMLFPCANGTLDLETGRLRPSRPGDFLTKSSPIEFHGITTPAPLWEKTILQIFNDEDEMVNYIHRFFGYCLTGDITEKNFSVFYGPAGWNGRSMILETISFVMGKFASRIPSEMLLASKYPPNANVPRPEITGLKGVRLATASEIEDGQKFSLSRVKWLTGQDSLTGRNPHEKQFLEFMPTHKLIVQTNHLPKADADDKAFWGRIHLVNFPLSFVTWKPTKPYERPANTKLGQELRKEAPGILAWLLRGCLLWQRDGLNPPQKVLDSTKEYREDEDMLYDYITARIKEEPGKTTPSKEIYSDFSSWYKEEHGADDAPTQSWFGKRFAAKFKRTKSNGIKVYEGVIIKKGLAVDAI